MKKLVLGAVLSLAAGFASANDICSKLPGHWHGIYTIIDSQMCELYHGCTHILMADATNVDGKLHVKIYPAVGEGGEIDLTCSEDGVLTSDLPATITTQCDSNNHCFVVFSNSMLTSEMGKV